MNIQHKVNKQIDRIIVWHTLATQRKTRFVILANVLAEAHCIHQKDSVNSNLNEQMGFFSHKIPIRQL